jgi:protein SCO1/2
MKRLAGVCCLLAACGPLAAQSGQGGQPRVTVQGTPEALRDVGIDQRLDEQVPLDLTFRDEEGREVALREYFDGKPVVLVLAYYRCPKLCNQVLQGLLDALKVLAFDIGKEFRVVTVSFDPRETPEVAAAKKRTFVDEYGRSGAAEGWHFLTGDEAEIGRLAEAVGFRYHYDAEKDVYAHAAGVMVLTPGGKLARYFFGIRYSPRDLRLGLVEASQGKVGSPVDRVLLFCYHYDARTGTYKSVMGAVRVGAVATLLALGGAGAAAWWRGRRRETQAAGGG